MNICIENMSDQTTEARLRQAFEEFGHVVAVNVILNRDTGRPIGLAYVDMPAKTEATAAINGLNGRDLNGRKLRVYEADQSEGNGNSLAGNRSRPVY